jgi:hypothetical protein
MRLVLLAVPLLAGCAVDMGAISEPPQFERIDDAGAFLDRVAGEPMRFDDGGVLVARPDGTLTGSFDGVAPQGTWRFENGRFCRTVSIGAQDFPQLCQLVEVKNGTLRLLELDGALSAEAELG